MYLLSKDFQTSSLSTCCIHTYSLPYFSTSISHLRTYLYIIPILLIIPSIISLSCYYHTYHTLYPCTCFPKTSKLALNQQKQSSSNNNVIASSSLSASPLIQQSTPTINPHKQCNIQSSHESNNPCNNQSHQQSNSSILFLRQ